MAANISRTKPPVISTNEWQHLAEVNDRSVQGGESLPLDAWDEMD